MQIISILRPILIKSIFATCILTSAFAQDEDIVPDALDAAINKSIFETAPVAKESAKESALTGKVTIGPGGEVAGSVDFSAKPNATTTGPIGLLEVKAQMTEILYEKEPNFVNLGNLVTVYESLVGALCMPKLLVEMDYQGPAQGEKCLAYIDKLAKLDLRNPVLECAQSGIRSRSCYELFSAQAVEKFVPGLDDNPNFNKSGNNNSIIAKTSSATSFPALEKAEQEYAKILSEISEMENKLKLQVENQKQANANLILRRNLNSKKEVLRKSISRLMYLSCSNVRLRLVEIPTERASDFIAQEHQIPSSDMKLFATPTLDPRYESEMNTSIFSSKKSADTTLPDPQITPTPLKENRYRRTRLLTTQCFDSMAKASLYDVNFPYLKCYEVGFYSPQCLDYVKKTKATWKNNDTKKSTGVGVQKNSSEKVALETF